MTATAIREPTDEEQIQDYYSPHRDRHTIPAELVRILGDRALVRVDKDPTELVSKGLVLSLVAANRPKEVWGEVIAVGPGRWLKRAKRYEPVGVEVGERVLFKTASAWAEVESDGREHVVLTSEQILGTEDT